MIISPYGFTFCVRSIPDLGVFCVSPQKGPIQDHAAKAGSLPIRISANSRTIFVHIHRLWLFTEFVASV